MMMICGKYSQCEHRLECDHAIPHTHRTVCTHTGCSWANDQNARCKQIKPDKTKVAETKEEPVIQKLEELADQTAKPKTAFDTQIDGNHYTKLAIQPMEYSFKNNLNCLQHTIVKYVTRYKDKGGLADLQKARHCIDMLIQLEYLEC